MTQTAPIHGLGTSTLITTLRAQPEWPLPFHLNGQPLVPAGYHITEIRAVTTEALDCGGPASA